MYNDDSMESRSPDVTHELQQIKERVTTVESILAHVHADKILDLVRNAIKGNVVKKAILRYCTEPRSKEELRSHLNLKSSQAVDHHLAPLRFDGLIEETAPSPGRVAFLRARIIEKLPKRDLRDLLEGD